MFVGISNTPRDYAWGSTTAMAHALGTAPSGRPEAELWLGAHPGSPSVIVEPDQADGATKLSDWIRAAPERTLGRTSDQETHGGSGVDGGSGADGGSNAESIQRLPFLMKVLAAASPLSLQAHPSPERALVGFAKEDAAGIPRDSPERSYKDRAHKPELIYALSPAFEALCGFRPVADTLVTLDALAAAAATSDRDALLGFASRLRQANAAGEGGSIRATVAWLLSGEREVAHVVDAVVRVAETEGAAGSAGDITDRTTARMHFEHDCETIRMLSKAFPSDPGIALSLLLHHVTLRAGEALYLRAGNIHAYLSGVGIEVMAASDNVLRGGLTAKHIDVPELLEVLAFEPVDVPFIHGVREAPGAEMFRPDVPDFALAHIVSATGSPAGPVSLDGPAIALCTDGSLEFKGAASTTQVTRGEAVYITPDEISLTVSGSGAAFVAMSNREEGSR